jgi:hypothetical protein
MPRRRVLSCEGVDVDRGEAEEEKGEGGGEEMDEGDDERSGRW